MATGEQGTSKTNELVLSPRDILFECPACGKSLVVDEAGEGMIVDCPQCHINVIVPPKAEKATAAAATTPTPPPAAPSPPAAEASQPAPAAAEGDEGADMRARLVALGSKLKELQTQRTEINNRMAARINEINRDIVMMARLEASHQQIISELNQLIGQIAGQAGGAHGAGRTRVNLRS